MFNTYEEVEIFLKEHDHRELYDNENIFRFKKRHPFVINKPIIHITGTNGKGSTLHYLEKIYRSSGYRVASFVSPSHYKYSEMIRVDENSIDDDIFVSYFNKYVEEFEKYDLTTFEMITLIMFYYFSSLDVDVILLEVGMGGEIDATNIVDDTNLSIITSVSLEHTAYLGKTISEIAYSKSGIFRKRTPFLLGEGVNEEAKLAIAQRAKKLKCEEIYLSSYQVLDVSPLEHKLSYEGHQYTYLGPRYGYHNLIIALSAAKPLNDKLPIDFSKLEKHPFESLDRRMEILGHDPLIIVDGAHSEEAVKELSDSLRLFNLPIHIIFACLEDKNLPLLLENLEKISHDIVLTTFDNKRARTENDYFIYLEDFPFTNDYVSLLKKYRELYKEDIILFVGSIAFIDEVRKRL